MIKKMQAFTLLELLIGMIISSIVIGFCYTGYSIIYRQYINYSKIKREIVSAMQLNTVLNTDFINAASVTFDTDKLMLNYENKLPLQYDFKENFILRKDREITDTFMFAPKNVIPIYLTESIESSDAQVNNFSFDVMLFGESEHFHFTKNYSAETMVNKQIQHLQNN